MARRQVSIRCLVPWRQHRWPGMCYHGRGSMEVGMGGREDEMNRAGDGVIMSVK